MITYVKKTCSLLIDWFQQVVLQVKEKLKKGVK